MKTCFIIGAGSGVSGAVARRFGREGYRIGLIARNLDRLHALAEDLRTDGIDAEYAVADAGSAAALDDALGRLEDCVGPCDVLIYNAAVLRASGPLNVTSDEIAAEFQVNLLGAHRAVRRLAPGMVARGAGAILFTGGGLSLEPFPEWTSLALGKAALRSLSLSLYKELKPKGVHVCVLAICGIVEPGGPFDPGAIADEYWRVATAPRGVADREVIFQPEGTDPFYNDPERMHEDVSVTPVHARGVD